MRSPLRWIALFGLAVALPVGLGGCVYVPPTPYSPGYYAPVAYAPPAVGYAPAPYYGRPYYRPYYY
jgi:hypothetical protein